MINTINNKVFRNANEAYEYLHDRILQDGVKFGDTKALFNVGFYITDPKDRKIINKERNWKEDNAEAEWQWYLTGSPYVFELGNIYGKIPEIWKRMANDSGRVNSNYGWQWQRSYDGVSQLDSVIKTLKDNPDDINKASTITNLGMFPMVYLKDIYLVNQRDFQNPQQLVQAIQHFANPNFKNINSDINQ